MEKSDTTWTVASDVRTIHSALGGESCTETVVTVRDGQGNRWEVTVEDFRLTTLRVFSDDVNTEAMRNVPLMQLRAIALAHVREVSERFESGEHLLGVLLDTEGKSVVMLPGARVSAAEFVQAWREEGVPKVGPGGQALRPNRRKSLATRFHTSTWNIDKWTRFVRDLGSLEQPEPKIPDTAAPGTDRSEE